MINMYARKTNQTILPPSGRPVTVSCVRPMLDAHVGAALWTDRRIAARTKLGAATAGLLLMAFLLTADLLLARWVFGVSGASTFSLSPITLAAGTALFSTLALLRLAPAQVVNVVRLQRGGVIPLRRR